MSNYKYIIKWHNIYIYIYISSFASDIMAVKSNTVYNNATCSWVCLTAQATVMIIHPSHALILTPNLLTWKMLWATNNVSKWQVRFNSAFKGLRISGFSSYAMISWTKILKQENISEFILPKFHQTALTFFLCCSQAGVFQ